MTVQFPPSQNHSFTFEELSDDGQIIEEISKIHDTIKSISFVNCKISNLAWEVLITKLEECPHITELVLDETPLSRSETPGLKRQLNIESLKLIKFKFQEGLNNDFFDLLNSAPHLKNLSIYESSLNKKIVEIFQHLNLERLCIESSFLSNDPGIFRHLIGPKIRVLSLTNVITEELTEGLIHQLKDSSIEKLDLSSNCLSEVIVEKIIESAKHSLKFLNLTGNRQLSLSNVIESTKKCDNFKSLGFKSIPLSEQEIGLLHLKPYRNSRTPIYKMINLNNSPDIYLSDKYLNIEIHQQEVGTKFFKAFMVNEASTSEAPSIDLKLEKYYLEQKNKDSFFLNGKIHFTITSIYAIEIMFKFLIMHPQIKQIVLTQCKFDTETWSKFCLEYNNNPNLGGLILKDCWEENNFVSLNQLKSKLHTLAVEYQIDYENNNEILTPEQISDFLADNSVIENLTLKNCDLLSIDEIGLESVKNLKTLSLKLNPMISVEGVVKIIKNTKLETLDLNDCFSECEELKAVMIEDIASALESRPLSFPKLDLNFGNNTTNIKSILNLIEKSKNKIKKLEVSCHQYLQDLVDAAKAASLEKLILTNCRLSTLDKQLITRMKKDLEKGRPVYKSDRMQVEIVEEEKIFDEDEEEISENESTLQDSKFPSKPLDLVLSGKAEGKLQIECNQLFWDVLLKSLISEESPYEVLLNVELNRESKFNICSLSGIEGLISSLERLPEVSSIFLINCRFSEETWNYFCQRIQGSKIVQLTFNNCALSPDQIRYLENLKKQLNKLIFLEEDDISFRNLSGFLKENAFLEELSFNTCSVNFVELAESLQLNKNLKKLSFDECIVGVKDVEALCRIIQNQKSLRELCLETCRLNDQILGGLAEALNNRCNNKISLNLSGNSISRQGLLDFIKKSGQGLEGISIYRQEGISEISFVAFQQGMNWISFILCTATEKDIMEWGRLGFRLQRSANSYSKELINSEKKKIILYCVNTPFELEDLSDKDFAVIPSYLEAPVPTQGLLDEIPNQSPGIQELLFKILLEKNFEIVPIDGDGNCLFNAVLESFPFFKQTLKIPDAHHFRSYVMRYMLEENEKFKHFVTDEDITDQTNILMAGNLNFDERFTLYCKEMLDFRVKKWGGELEITAISDLLESHQQGGIEVIDRAKDPLIKEGRITGSQKYGSSPKGFLYRQNGNHYSAAILKPKAAEDDTIDEKLEPHPKKRKTMGLTHESQLSLT